MTEPPQPPQVPPEDSNSPSTSPTPEREGDPARNASQTTNLSLNLPPKILAQILAQGGVPVNLSPGAQQAGILFHIGAPQPSILQQSWQGPYPPPDAIEKYEHALPGFFDRIVNMAERMEAAQIEQSAKALAFQASAVKTGQWLGFAMGAIALVGAVICGFLGEQWLAAAFVSVPVMGVATALVNSHRGASKPDSAGALNSPSSPPPPAPAGSK